MNRADLLYEVLKDGQPHSRRDIQRRVGFFLTNNAASELRERGFTVTHSKKGGVDSYQLGSLRERTVGPEIDGASSSAVLSRSESGTIGGANIPSSSEPFAGAYAPAASAGSGADAPPRDQAPEQLPLLESEAA